MFVRCPATDKEKAYQLFETSLGIQNRPVWCPMLHGFLRSGYWHELAIFLSNYHQELVCPGMDKGKASHFESDNEKVPS